MSPTQYGMMGALVGLGLLGVYQRRPLTNTLRDFFSRPDHPLNLALFRVVLVFTVLTTIDPATVHDYSRMSTDLLSPPYGTGWMMPGFPLDPTMVAGAVVVAYVVGTLALIGLYTRFSLMLFTAASFYLLTIPQLFGKVNHYHHLIWFLVILCFSPCARVLSVDALRDAWRADPTDNRPEPSARYGLPLRFCWVLMGILYFFPGFWKLWQGGMDWVLGDQLQYVLYHKWFELGGWTPAFRIDRYPLLLGAGALFAIVFEVGFIAALFRKTTRYLWAAMGLAFHQFTSYFMKISFWNLQVLYVMFVDWHELFVRLGRTVWEEPLRVRVNPGFPRVVGVLNALRRVDLLDQLSVGVEAVDSSSSSTALTVESVPRTHRNQAALDPILRRLPLGWPVLLCLWVPPVRRYLWQRLSVRGNGTRRPRSPAAPVVRGSILHRALLLAGAFMIATTALFGAAGKGFAWPLATYPSFAQPRGPTIWTIELEMTRNDDTLAVMDEAAIRRALGVPSERLRGLVRRLLDAENFSDFRRRSRSLVDQLSRREALPPGTERVRVHSVERWVHPDRLDDEPVRRNRVITLRWSLKIQRSRTGPSRSRNEAGSRPRAPAMNSDS